MAFKIPFISKDAFTSAIAPLDPDRQDELPVFNRRVSDNVPSLRFRKPDLGITLDSLGNVALNNSTAAGIEDMRNVAMQKLQGTYAMQQQAKAQANTQIIDNMIQTALEMEARKIEHELTIALAYGHEFCEVQLLNGQRQRFDLRAFRGWKRAKAVQKIMQQAGIMKDPVDQKTGELPIPEPEPKRAAIAAITEFEIDKPDAWL